jgi:UDP-glucose 4-epimerase
MRKTIIISGINGFLGNRLKEILKGKFNIYGIAKEESFNENSITFSSKKLEEITLKPDFLILCHAAVSSGTTCQSNDLLYDVNVKLTDRIISKFNTSKIIYISSASIYNPNEGVISEKTTNSPTNEYAISKFWAEKLVLKTKNAVVIRLSSLYGINMKENTIIPNYINQALSNNSIEVWGDGNRKQNYIFIDDVCNLVLKTLFLHDKVSNETLLAVNNGEYSNLDLAVKISEITKSKIEFIKEDNSISLYFNNKKTQSLLNWAPQANFEQEIINYIKWKQKQYL